MQNSILYFLNKFKKLEFLTNFNFAKIEKSTILQTCKRRCNSIIRKGRKIVESSCGRVFSGLFVEMIRSVLINYFVIQKDIEKDKEREREKERKKNILPREYWM